MLWCVWLGTSAASLAVLWPAHQVALSWDEVDYVGAARLGAWANMVDRGALSPRAFVDYAIAKRHGARPVLPRGYEESRDPLVRRHFHPPLVALLVAPGADSRSERVLRASQDLGACALAAVMLVGYVSIARTPSWPGLALVSLFSVWMSTVAFSTISCHGWMAVWATAAATAFHHWTRRGTPTAALGVCGSLAAAMFTLPTGVFVVFALGLCVVFAGRIARPLRHRIRTLVMAGVLSGLLLALAWPGSVTKISLIRIFGLHVYRIAQGQEYAAAGANALNATLALWPAVVICGIVLARLPVRTGPRLATAVPFAAIGIVYLLGTFGFALSPVYLIPAFAPLVCIAAAAVDQMPGRLTRPALVLIPALALPGAVSRQFRTRAEDAVTREEFQWLADILRNRTAYIDGAHIYRHYLGDGFDIRPLSIGPDGRLFTREGGAYEELPAEALRGRLVLIRPEERGRQEALEGGGSAALLGGCRPINRPRLLVYDCAFPSGVLRDQP